MTIFASLVKMEDSSDSATSKVALKRITLNVLEGKNLLQSLKIAGSVAAIHASSAIKPQSSVVLAAHKLYVDDAFTVPSSYVFEAVEDFATTV